MQSMLRKSLAAKIVAVGFIILTLTGNIWIVDHMMNQPIPIWLHYLLYLGVVLVLLGGIALALLAVKVYAYPDPPSENE